MERALLHTLVGCVRPFKRLLLESLDWLFLGGYKTYLFIPLKECTESIPSQSRLVRFIGITAAQASHRQVHHRAVLP